MGSFIDLPSRCIPRDGSTSRYSAFGGCAALRLALERALPQELALAAVVSDPPREDEEQVGETVEIGERPLADVLATHETEHVAFRATAHGASDVEERAHAPATRKHERLEGLQVLLAAVEYRLERLHLRRADPEHPRDECRGRRRELAPEVEQLVLEPLQDGVELAGRRRTAELRRVHGARDADRRVQLVDRPVRFDPETILRDTRPADQVRVSLIAAPGVDACESDGHRPSLRPAGRASRPPGAEASAPRRGSRPRGRAGPSRPAL